VYKGLGEMGYPLTAEHVSERFGVPLPEAGQIVLTPSSPAPAIAARMFAKQRAAAKDAGYTPEQEALEDLVAQALGENDAAMRAIVAPVVEIVRAAGSFEELQAKVAEAFADMDALDLEDLVARTVFAAEMWGRFTAQKERV
jgi:phage gp29-like protein